MGAYDVLLTVEEFGFSNAQGWIPKFKVINISHDEYIISGIFPGDI